MVTMAMTMMMMMMMTMTVVKRWWCLFSVDIGATLTWFSLGVCVHTWRALGYCGDDRRDSHEESSIPATTTTVPTSTTATTKRSHGSLP